MLDAQIYQLTDESVKDESFIGILVVRVSRGLGIGSLGYGLLVLCLTLCHSRHK